MTTTVTGACCTGLDTCTDASSEDCTGIYFEQQTCSDITCPTAYSVDDDGLDDPDADFSSIQAAIDAAEDGDVINLTDEVYEEGAEIDMRGKAITLKGDGKGSSPGNPAVSIQGQGTHRIIACRSGETSQTVSGNLELLKRI